MITVGDIGGFVSEVVLDDIVVAVATVATAADDSDSVDDGVSIGGSVAAVDLDGEVDDDCLISFADDIRGIDGIIPVIRVGIVNGMSITLYTTTLNVDVCMVQDVLAM